MISRSSMKGELVAWLRSDDPEATIEQLVDRLLDDGAASEAPSPATALRDRFKRTKVREISHGWRVELRSLSLTGELLRGSLPNPVLAHVLFDDTPEEERGPDYHQLRFEGYRAIAARALVSPRLILDRDGDVEPDYDKGEIGPDDLTFQELQNIYWYAVKEVVPPAETAPFPARPDDGGGTGGIGRAGAALQPIAESLPGNQPADG